MDWREQARSLGWEDESVAAVEELLALAEGVEVLWVWRDSIGADLTKRYEVSQINRDNGADVREITARETHGYFRRHFGTSAFDVMNPPEAQIVRRKGAAADAVLLTDHAMELCHCRFVRFDRKRQKYIHDYGCELDAVIVGVVAKKEEEPAQTAPERPREIERESTQLRLLA